MCGQATGETTLGIIKEGLMYGETMSTLSAKLPSTIDLLLGITSGSVGEMSALALLLGGVFLLARKVITWHIPITVLATMAVMTGIFWLVDPEQYANPLIHVLSGGAILGAFYMATDLVTSPMTKKGMIIFAIGATGSQASIWPSSPLPTITDTLEAQARYDIAFSDAINAKRLLDDASIRLPSYSIG